MKVIFTDSKLVDKKHLIVRVLKDESHQVPLMLEKLYTHRDEEDYLEHSYTVMGNYEQEASAIRKAISIIDSFDGTV